jgi:hypothetical protein
VPTVALATCERFPDLDAEDRLLIPALEGLGISAVPAVWTDPTIDWSTFDAVVIRETWDYSGDREAFLAWAAHVEASSRLFNPADVIAWDTDKHYLHDIERNGLSVVPTTFVEPGADVSEWVPPADSQDYVVKPAISCGSQDTVRYSSAAPSDIARDHVRRLVDEGRAVMVQPYLDSVDTAGETALLFFNGEFSHAIRKGPLLVRGIEGERVEGLFVPEQIDPREPSLDELVTARAIVECIPGGLERVLYARVDLIADEYGTPHLLELELCEPSLFLSHSEGAADRLAAAISARLGQ